MAVDKDAAFTLSRGATGFFQPKDGPLPETDQRTFRAALYAAARAAGGHVGEIEEQTYPRTFHTATVIEGAGECIILCHAYHPWIAFAQERRDWYTEEFIALPPWAHTFTDLGFVVLDRAQLTLALFTRTSSRYSLLREAGRLVTVRILLLVRERRGEFADYGLGEHRSSGGYQ
ncbi:hypothetical protein [Streptomyces altiplanensis]